MVPDNSTASITSVVATGRRMKCSAMFMRSWRCCAFPSWRAVLELYLDAGGKADLSVGDDAFSGGEALRDDRIGGDRGAGGHRADGDGGIGIDDEHVRSL